MASKLRVSRGQSSGQSAGGGSGASQGGGTKTVTVKDLPKIAKDNIRTGKQGAAREVKR